eukprot:COSAG01_NODE_9788_length_2343_cov_5.243316_1_plen_64_part_10
MEGAKIARRDLLHISIIKYIAIHYNIILLYITATEGTLNFPPAAALCFLPRYVTLFIAPDCVFH